MSDSVLVVVGSEAAAGLFDERVVPDARGEREDALADASPDALGGMATVTLERELALEGVVDGLDPLADAAERPEARLLVAAVGTDELRAERLGDELLELGAREPLVGDEDLLAVQQLAAGCAFEQRRGDLALALVGGRQTERDRHPVGRAQQVEPQAPEVARVRGAVAIGGKASQLGALDRLARGAARHRRGVQQPQPVAERRRTARQMADDLADRGREPTQPLVVSGLLGDVGEQVPQPRTREAQKPPLGRAVQEDLRDSERDELGVGDLRAAPRTAAHRQEIGLVLAELDALVTALYVVVDTSVVDVALATPNF